jgi:hypothetical protein
MKDLVYVAGKRDGAHDAQSPKWLDWLHGTLTCSTVNLHGDELEQYIAGYLVGMADRLRELAAEREGVQS